MVVLRTLTWEEFETVVRVLKDYGKRVSESDPAEASECEALVCLLGSASRRPRDIEVKGLRKDGVRRIAIILDLWNAVRNPIGSAHALPYDRECDEISGKLRHMYSKVFRESVYAG